MQYSHHIPLARYELYPVEQEDKDYNIERETDKEIVEEYNQAVDRQARSTVNALVNWNPTLWDPGKIGNFDLTTDQKQSISHTLGQIFPSHAPTNEKRRAKWQQRFYDVEITPIHNKSENGHKWHVQCTCFRTCFVSHKNIQ